MKGKLKNTIILVSALLAVIFLIFSINSYQDAAKQKQLVDQERRTRMELEEKVLSLSNLNTDLEQKVMQLQEALNQKKTTFETTYQGFAQEISKLKEELEKLTKTNKKLEERLKERP